MDGSNSLKPERNRPILFYTVCIYAAMWLLASVHAAMGTYQTAIISEYSLEESQKGLPSSMLSLFTIATFAAILFTAGRFKKILAFMAGLALGAVSLIGVLPAAGSPFGLFLVLIAVAGIACGTVDSLNSAVINELYPGKSGVMCLLHATYGLAGFAMPFVFKLLVGDAAVQSASVDGWRVAFFVIGLAMAVLFAALMLIVLKYKDRVEAAPKPEQRISRDMIRQVFSVKALRPIFLSSILGGMYLNCMLVWTPRFIEFGHNGASYKDWALPAVYLGITASRLIMSLIKPDLRRTLRRIMLPAALLLIAAALVKSPVLAIALLMLSAFCYAPVIPFQVTMAGNALPDRRFAVTVSLMLAMMLGQMLISPVIGFTESAWGINCAMLLAAAMMAASWLAALFIKPNDKKI